MGPTRPAHLWHPTGLVDVTTNPRLFMRGLPSPRSACSATALVATAMLMAGCVGGVTDPKGPIGAENLTILVDSLAIMLAIVVPTILTTVAFA